jgi:predicted phage tail protein
LQLIKIVLHGPLTKRFEELEVYASTAAEALEGWSRQVGMDRLPLHERPVVHVIDFETEELLRAPTEATTLHLIPAMFGGGGGFGKIIIGAVQIVAGAFIGGPIGAALIVSGVTTALMGVVELFMKQPSVSKEEDPEASKYLGTGKNTTAIGTLIGMGGGRMMIGGQILSLQVNSSDLVHGSFPVTPT